MLLMTKAKQQPLVSSLRGAARQVWTLKHVGRLVRAASKAKSFIEHLLLVSNRRKKRRRQQQEAEALARMALYSRAYWPSAHVMPISVVDGGFQKADDALFYYDSSWNSVFPPTDDFEAEEDEPDAPAAGCKAAAAGKPAAGNTEAADEIDRMADVFIASFHERFRLEKQESYRRFQEMLARGNSEIEISCSAFEHSDKI
ncbi:hypothetical protein EJ110_NYTH19064 [Nymphaea thermarum]|nr:hypothetical protein EJ110_NYTH19064 [Nymphaea thermarum]